MRVDYVIIGAGLAGTVVEHFLHDDSKVLLDPHPGAYKIGEAMAPEHHQHPELAALLPEVAKLPSYVPKMGSMFVSSDAIASFPLPRSVGRLAIHASRHELERLMHETWRTPIVREKVVEVDVARHLVRTDRCEYEVRRQIIDCSGPAMVVARSLGIVEELWPVYARWAYYDIVDIDDARFWQTARESGKRLSHFAALTGELLTTAGEKPWWEPSRMTILTEVEPGLWTWQIPLYDRKLLSFGVVSKQGRVSEALLEDLRQRTQAAHYTLKRHPHDASSPFGHDHVRDHFAQRARVPSTPDYILVSDACAFADPIYSVGSALAVNKALEVATALNEGEWDAAQAERYNSAYAALLSRAVNAFEYWYTRELVERPEAAAEVQRDYLQGAAFQNGVARHYSQLIVDTLVDETLAERGDLVRETGSGTKLLGEVGNLLRVDIERRLLDERVPDWWLAGAGRVPGGGFVLRWRHPRKPPFVVQVGVDPEPTQYLRRVGTLSLTYMSLKDGAYPFDDACEQLLAVIAERLAPVVPQWMALTTGASIARPVGSPLVSASGAANS